jgi:hypothetical protein
MTPILLSETKWVDGDTTKNPATGRAIAISNFR